MKIYLLFFVLLFTCNLNFAKSVNFYNDIQPIIFNHCTSCHSENNNTPFVLNSYESVAYRIKTILKVINENIMPPFPADAHYANYYNQNILTNSEKEFINKWATSGLKKGKNVKKYIPERKIKPTAIKYDIDIPLMENQKIPASDKDIYVYRLLNWNFDKSKPITDYNFVIQSPFLHHAEILSINDIHNYDTTKDSTLISHLYENKIFYIDKYLFGWFPGSDIGSFPIGTQMLLDSLKKYLLILHYIPTSSDFIDSSRFQLKINKNSFLPLKEIHEFAVHGTAQFIRDNKHLPFIPANTIKTFHYTEVVPNDMLAYAVYGHAHHLCKSMLAYAVTPEFDTIPLMKINDWKFNWQLTYNFKRYQKIPQHSVVHFYATFDNTENNPENMHRPPVDVAASFNAANEMMEFFMLYINYEKEFDNKLIKYNNY